MVESSMSDEPTSDGAYVVSSGSLKLDEHTETFGVEFVEGSFLGVDAAIGKAGGASGTSDGVGRRSHCTPLLL